MLFVIKKIDVKLDQLVTRMHGPTSKLATPCKTVDKYVIYFHRNIRTLHFRTINVCQKNFRTICWHISDVFLGRKTLTQHQLFK